MGWAMGASLREKEAQSSQSCVTPLAAVQQGIGAAMAQMDNRQPCVGIPGLMDQKFFRL